VALGGSQVPALLVGLRGGIGGNKVGRNRLLKANLPSVEDTNGGSASPPTWRILRGDGDAGRPTAGIGFGVRGASPKQKAGGSA
jgi:hypothetical protein